MDYLRGYFIIEMSRKEETTDEESDVGHESVKRLYIVTQVRILFVFRSSFASFNNLQPCSFAVLASVHAMILN